MIKPLLGITVTRSPLPPAREVIFGLVRFLSLPLAFLGKNLLARLQVLAAWGRGEPMTWGAVRILWKPYIGKFNDTWPLWVVWLFATYGIVCLAVFQGVGWLGLSYPLDMLLALAAPKLRE